MNAEPHRTRGGLALRRELVERAAGAELLEQLPVRGLDGGLNRSQLVACMCMPVAPHERVARPLAPQLARPRSLATGGRASGALGFAWLRGRVHEHPVQLRLEA